MRWGWWRGNLLFELRVTGSKWEVGVCSTGIGSSELRIVVLESYTRVREEERGGECCVDNSGLRRCRRPGRINIPESKGKQLEWSSSWMEMSILRRFFSVWKC